MSISEPEDSALLRRYLSADRFGTYLRECNGAEAAALALYGWNVRLAGELMVVTGMVEVLIRNAMDEQLVVWAASRQSVEWWHAAPLDDRAKSDVAKAMKRATWGRATPRPVPHGKVVAELSFGFWRFLASRRYLTTLWIPALNQAFPHGATDSRRRRQAVEQHLQQLTFVRNRAAHHEPLFHRDLARDHALAVEVITWIDPRLAAWLEASSQLPDLLARRPHP